MNTDRPLYYLFISADKYPPFRVDVAVLFGQEMVKRGHRIDWLLQSEDDCSKMFVAEWNGSTVYVGKTDNGESLLHRLKKHIYGVLHDLRVFRLSRKNQYDFILVKDKFVAAVFAIIAGKIYRRKIVYWLSYPFPEASLYEADVGTARYPFLYRIRGHIFKYILYRIIARHAEHVFVQSEQMKKDVVSEGMSPGKVTAVPMGISMDLFRHDQSASTPIEPGFQKSIVYLGTLLGTRKLDFLIRVFALVKQKVHDAKLYMVGPEELPDDMKKLSEEARRCDVEDSVVFTGGLPREEALTYVRNSNVCVSPFYPTPILNSTSPTKLIEYMAMKKPVVANDHPEQSLVIAESAGGICVPYEEQPFADAIVQLLENTTLAENCGENGYRYVLKYRTYPYLSGMVNQRLQEMFS